MSKSFALGHMLSDGIYTFEYDSSYMPQKVWDGDVLVEEYWYGPGNERLKKVQYFPDGNITTFYPFSDYGTIVDSEGVSKEGQRIP
jgi:hypothetical protein